MVAGKGRHMLHLPRIIARQKTLKEIVNFNIKAVRPPMGSKGLYLIEIHCVKSDFIAKVDKLPYSQPELIIKKHGEIIRTNNVETGGTGYVKTNLHRF